MNFNDFVLSTCNPNHVRSARMGMADWTQVGPSQFVSPSTGFHHDCHPDTCKAWVMRFLDGVRICAISGNMHLNPPPIPPQQDEMAEIKSNRKRVSHGEDTLKRHQDKPLVGSSAYLSEKFNLDRSDDGDMEMDEGRTKQQTAVVAFVGQKSYLY
ncbi:hypothetical protein BASA82_000651 [Batrachochytrium salamandrivorans]|nr:hypothetical protein BASA82_000651 [Batrachochytrium salamandrivorans]